MKIELNEKSVVNELNEKRPERATVSEESEKNEKSEKRLCWRLEAQRLRRECQKEKRRRSEEET